MIKVLRGVELMSAHIQSLKTNAHVYSEYAIGVMEYGVQGYDPKKPNDNYMTRGDIPVVNPNTVHNSQNMDDKGFRYKMFY